GPLFDLASVQVLPGPQGTLFGLSATGGAILIEPQRPTNKLEGYAKVDLGSLGKRSVEAALNMPIIADKVLLRIAGNRGVRDGIIKELDNGKDLSNEDYYNWRVGLTVRPTENFENYFLYRGSYSHTNGTGKVFIGYDPTGLTARIYGAATLAALLADQQALGPHQIRAASQNQAMEELMTGVLTDIARVELTDDLAVKFVGSYVMPGRNSFRDDHDGTLLLVADENQTVQQLSHA